MPSTGEGFGLVFSGAAGYGVPRMSGRHNSVQEIVLDIQTSPLVEQNPDDIALGAFVCSPMMIWRVPR